MTDRRTTGAVAFAHTVHSYSMRDVPGYRAWSEGKRAAGESEYYLDELGSRRLCLSPDELARVTYDEFEELLTGLKDQLAVRGLS